MNPYNVNEENISWFSSNIDNQGSERENQQKSTFLNVLLYDFKSCTLRYQYGESFQKLFGLVLGYTFCLVLKWFSWFSFSGLRYQLSAYYYLWSFWAVSTVHIVIKGSRYVSANIFCWHALDMLCLLDWREKAERIVILSGHIKWITHQSWRIS